MTRSLIPCLVAGVAAASLGAQSYVDLLDSRNAAQPYRSLFQLEAGAIGVAPTSDGFGVNEGLDDGLDDGISWDGKLYYRDDQFGGRRGTLEAYAGRDGLFAGFADGKLIGDETVTRFEFHARPWMFYRDGFYRGDTLVQNGAFRGSDYEGYVGFGREANEGLYVEFGPFYKRLQFSEDERRQDNLFAAPDDFAAYGGRLYIEQSNVQMDRRRGTARDGFVLTLIGEREWNDSKGSYGPATNSTVLPSAVWRARGRLEWYVAGSDTMIWEVFAHGGWQAELDRLQNTEGQRPLGNQWGDGQVRLRMHLGDSFVLTPFVHVQYSNLRDDRGLGNQSKIFVGGGAEAWLHFGDSVSMHAWYSYLDNENRPSIRIDEDVHGQSMFYLGMVLRLGGARR